jgi:uncharacterized membrane protein YbhN (UPF0104 family)
MQGPERRVERRSARRRALLRIAVSALVLALLLLALPFDELVRAVRRVPPAVGAAALGAYLCLHLLGVLKWRLLVNSAGAGLSVAQAARCYYAGLFGNTFLPSIVGGDVVRAGVALGLARSKAGVVLGSLVDRALDVVALAAVAGSGALLVPGALDPQSRAIFLGLAGLLAGGALAAGLVLAVLRPRRVSLRTRRRMMTVRTIARSMAARPRLVALALAMGIALQALLVVLNARLGAACGIEIGLAVWLFVWPLAKLSALVPITQGGIGVREAAQVALFAPFGVPAVLALAAGLVFELIVVTGGLVGGLIALLLRRLAAPTAERAEVAAAPAAHG